VIRDFLNPDFLLVGEFDERSGAHLEECYRDITANKAPAARMSLENAELAKISVNAFVTTKITFANMLADICSRLPGGNVDVVSNAIGLDSRIGRKYLTGALGYGGPCFPRDNVALAFFAAAIGATAELPATTDRLNRGLADRMVAYVAAHAAPGSTVAVLGLSYKPASHIVEESQAIALVKALVDRHYRVVAYDPLAGATANQELRGRALILDSAAACVRSADVVLVTTPDPQFASLRASDFGDGSKPPVVIDFWRTLAPTLAHEPAVKYVAYGYGGPDDEAARQRVIDLWSDAVRYVGGV
jgi:UDPglucose 6-dehydrogenase